MRSIQPKIIQLPDEDLLIRSGKGDESAFADLFDRISPPILALLRQMMGDEKEAEDVLQEGFVYLWTKASEYNPERGKAFTWAVVIFRHKAIDKLRSKGRRARLAEQAAVELPALMETAEHASADQRADERERHDLVRRAVSSLPTDQRQLIECAFLKGLTHHAISESLGLPLGTVKTHIRRGLSRLRDLLKGGGIES